MSHLNPQNLNASCFCEQAPEMFCYVPYSNIPIYSNIRFNTEKYRQQGKHQSDQTEPQQTMKYDLTTCLRSLNNKHTILFLQLT